MKLIKRKDIYQVVFSQHAQNVLQVDSDGGCATYNEVGNFVDIPFRDGKYVIEYIQRGVIKNPFNIQKFSIEIKDGSIVYISNEFLQYRL